MKIFIRKYAGFLMVTWTLIIFVLCATPGQYIPSASWLDLLSIDKWVHAGIFFTLSTLWIITASKNKWSRAAVLYGLLACILYGGLLEVMQAKCFSNRSADWQDFVANSFGCLVALGLLQKIKTAFLLQDNT
jgi:VanZ family protein